MVVDESGSPHSVFPKCYMTLKSKILSANSAKFSLKWGIS